MISAQPLQPEKIQKALDASLFGTNLLYYPSIPSTNSLAKELGAKGAPEGTLVLAEEQSAGKGRMGRRWLSQGHENLLFSILLRPRLLPDRLFVLTMVLALAASDGVEEMTGLRPLIKWPNDLYLNGKKLAGILTEVTLGGKGIHRVVLGMGLNVNWRPKKGEAMRYPATSIRAESGNVVPREALLIHILKAFEDFYQRVLSGDLESFYQRWNALSLILGRDVEVVSGEDCLKGKAVRIDHYGALIIRDEQGKDQRVLNGDVSLRLGGAP
jgi:BirA family biotin operon repressor/biotin-[acetyl-CoA-carboxylase] ligase